MNELKENELVSRKKALKKISKYISLTALSTFMILSPRESQAQSTPPDAGGSPF